MNADTGPTNALYYGDNLEVLRRHLKGESVDLVYLDPPFKSSQDYNVLFAEQDGSRSAAQIRAFGDTWRWDQAAAASYQEMVEAGGKISEAIQALRRFLGPSDMMAYLAMMAPRLSELHRVLKANGSLYLHCDPTASHYLKILLDAIFGPTNYRNEIIWKRTGAHNDPRRYGANIDVLLFYTKTDEWTWNQIYLPHGADYVARFRNRDPDGRLWADDNLTAKGLSGGGYEYEYKGVKSLWRCPPETMRQLDAEGRLHFTKAGGIRLKRYLDENKGLPLQALWDDIPPINSQAQERLGYPTQKPEALLERVIQASSNPGELILDPFCGCGTTIAVAQRLARRWVGIDITHLAINLIKHRLQDSFGKDIRNSYAVVGEPVSLPDATDLAAQDPYQFQFWVLGLVGARPAEQKKGADQGIDGRLYFHDEHVGGKTKQIIISVKAGHLTVAHLRDLRGVVDREEAQIGVLLCMEEPTKPMRAEAASAGFYVSPALPNDKTRFPRIQVLTVPDLLAGKTIAYPLPTQTSVTFKKAQRVAREKAEEGTLPGVQTPDLRRSGRQKA